MSTACRTPNTCMLSVVPGPAAGIPHNMTPKKRVETKKGPNPLIVENGRPSGWDRISYRALNTKSVRVDLIPKISRAFGAQGLPTAAWSGADQKLIWRRYSMTAVLCSFTTCVRRSARAATCVLNLHKFT